LCWLPCSPRLILCGSNSISIGHQARYVAKLREVLRNRGRLVMKGTDRRFDLFEAFLCIAWSTGNRLLAKTNPLLPRCCLGKSGLMSHSEPTGADSALANFFYSPRRITHRLFSPYWSEVKSGSIMPFAPSFSYTIEGISADYFSFRHVSRPRSLEERDMTRGLRLDGKMG
jgi:hypothetical protein